MKEFLSREGHAFDERYVEQDDAAYEALLATGFRTVPVTVIGGLAVKGYEEARLRDALIADGRATPDR